MLAIIYLSYSVPIIYMLIACLVGLSILVCSMIVDYFRLRRIEMRFEALNNEDDLADVVAYLNKFTSSLQESIMSKQITNLSKEYWRKLKVTEQQNEVELEYINTWLHEIKVPLSNLKINSTRQKDLLNLQEIEKIEDNLPRILNMKRLGSIETSYKLEEFDLEDVVNKIIKQFKSHIIYNKISIEIDVEDVMLYSDKYWVSFIISQLVSNSVKYDTKLLSIKFADNCLYLKDNGLGIDKGELTKIFDKFFVGSNTKSLYKSTGMGLYLVKQACDDLGIEISASSEVNVGTEFVIRFPDKAKKTI